MEKTLGLDLGTASIGWAIVEKNETGYTLLDKGVDIFQEGVAREKNIEKPAVQDRTNARALRRHYFRRRLRKIELLKVLIKYDLCPPLTDESLDRWKKEKIYPLTEEFVAWQRTDDSRDKNPYHDRCRALTETLELDRQNDRYALGRALYHLSQRRGFLSNRKDADKESEKGQVKKGIEDLSKAMEKAGCRFLGEYFYRLYGQKAQEGKAKDKIRTRYTARNEHYRSEFALSAKNKTSPRTYAKPWKGPFSSSVRSNRKKAPSGNARSRKIKAAVRLPTLVSRNSGCSNSSTTSVSLRPTTSNRSRFQDNR